MKSIIYILLNYINGAFHDDTYDHIAYVFLMNIEKLRTLSLEDAAILCDCSYSTINRFCKKIGFANYSSLRDILRIQDDQILPFVGDNSHLISEFIKQVDEIDHLILHRFNQTILQSKRIVLLGYGEFQYTSLYYQKQMFSLHKLIEVKNIYIDNYDFSKLEKDDLVIVVSMNGEFLKPRSKYFETIKCNKVIITMKNEPNFIKMFKDVIVLPKAEESFNKYILSRLYERLIQDYMTMVHL